MENKEKIINDLEEECVKINLQASSGKHFDEKLLMTLYRTLEFLKGVDDRCQ